MARGPASNVHFRNNLILSAGATLDPVFAVGTYTNYSTSDYNGFRPNPGQGRCVRVEHAAGRRGGRLQVARRSCTASRR